MTSKTPKKTAATPRSALSRKVRRTLRDLRGFWLDKIWAPKAIEDRSRWGIWMRWMRVAFITWDGLMSNRLFSRAASLSYSSLIGLGPLIAMVVLLSGTFLRGDAELQIKRMLLFVAPTLQEYITLDEAARPSPTGEEEEVYATALDELISQIVEGAEATIQQIDTGGSQAFGLIGLLILIFIAIQLLTAVETTLNAIWGTRSGRAWGQRIVSYWTFISLGAVLGLGGTALLSASAVANMFEVVPFGDALTRLFVLASPLLGFGMITLLLTAFYTYFPNANVQVRPAFIGAVVVAVLLFLNNYLSILYVGQVLRLQSLYGSVGIIPVLMLGLYFFWVFILLGGQLSYAVQNVNFLSRREAWSQVSARTQETLTLAAFLVIAREFAAQRPPPSAAQLSERMRVPGNVLNESLNLLSDIGWITPTPVIAEDGNEELCYQPARPLKRLTLARFHAAFEDYGNSGGIDFIEHVDPLIGHYRDGLEAGLGEKLGKRSLDDLFAETAEDESPDVKDDDEPAEPAKKQA